MLGIKTRQKPSDYDRISKIDQQIQNIQQTVYPDGFEEIRDTMVEALRELKINIVEGKD